MAILGCPLCPTCSANTCGVPPGPPRTHAVHSCSTGGPSSAPVRRENPGTEGAGNFPRVLCPQKPEHSTGSILCPRWERLLTQDVTLNLCPTCALHAQGFVLPGAPSSVVIILFCHTANTTTSLRVTNYATVPGAVSPPLTDIHTHQTPALLLGDPDRRNLPHVAPRAQCL